MMQMMKHQEQLQQQDLQQLDLNNGHSTSGTVTITTIDSSTFTDDNSTLMTSNAIKNKIEGYEYLDTITLTAGTGINFSNTSTTNNTFASTISCDLEGVELSSTDISGTNGFYVPMEMEHVLGLFHQIQYISSCCR